MGYCEDDFDSLLVKDVLEAQTVATDCYDALDEEMCENLEDAADQLRATDRKTV